MPEVAIQCRRKILFFIPFLLGEGRSGGIERVVLMLLNHFNQKEFNIILVAFERESRTLDCLPVGIKVIGLGFRRRRNFFKLLFELRTIIKKEKPEFCFSFGVYANILSVLSNLYLKTNQKCVLSERCHYQQYILLGGLTKHLVPMLMRITYRRAYRIIAVSEEIRESLIEEFDLPVDKIKTIYNPISLEEVADRSAEEVRHDFFTKRREGYVLISAGRLAARKRFDILLKVHAIVNKNINAHLLILGEGKLSDELKALALKLGISEKVDFVGHQRNPYKWIAKSDVFVFSSECEGFPNSIIEAMACKTAVISTDCPSGPKEIITDGVNGILTPVNNVEALAEAICCLLKNENLRKQLANAGMEHVRSLSVEKITKEYEETFR